VQFPGSNPELGPGQQATSAADAGAVAPRAGWPAKNTLDYHKTLIELLLLVLAIPWILKQLVKHPGNVSRQAASRHLKGS
jgi:hypothetical protein